MCVPVWMSLGYIVLDVGVTEGSPINITALSLILSVWKLAGIVATSQSMLPGIMGIGTH